MHSFFKTMFSLLLSCLFALLLSSCEPIPDYDLDADEREYYLKTLAAQMKRNYPLTEYEKKYFGVDADFLIGLYSQRAREDMTNNEFYTLMHDFVARFSDGHFSLRFNAPSTHGLAHVAYLGFSGIRYGENLYVNSVLPFKDEESPYPVQVGDEITQIKHPETKKWMKLADFIEEELVRYHHVGSKEANATALINRIFTRFSLSLPLPKQGENITFKRLRDGKEQVVTLPWRVDDLADFRLRESSQTAAVMGNLSKLDIEPTGEAASHFKGAFRLNFTDFAGKPISLYPSLEARSLMNILGGQKPEFNFSIPQDIGGFTVNSGEGKALRKKSLWAISLWIALTRKPKIPRSSRSSERPLLLLKKQEWKELSSTS